MIFQSTRPSRGETISARASMLTDCHFNPLAPRGARRIFDAMPRYVRYFNPLAPRGARRGYFHILRPPQAISIHSPLAGRDAPPLPPLPIICLFQSTRPSRGETRLTDPPPPNIIISIHSPLAGRDRRRRRCANRRDISIHSPLAGRDCIWYNML